MSRWSLANRFSQISHKQFFDYTTKFKEAVENSFGTECAMEVRGMSAPKLYTTYAHSPLQPEIDRTNKENLLFTAVNIEDVTPELWEETCYVEVILKPVYEDRAPRSAFAIAKFKGELPKVATFYIQPEGEDVRQEMVSENSGIFAYVSDELESNGIRKGLFAPRVQYP